MANSNRISRLMGLQFNYGFVTARSETFAILSSRLLRAAKLVRRFIPMSRIWEHSDNTSIVSG